MGSAPIAHHWNDRANVYLLFAAMPEFIAVPAGSLDAYERFAPQVLTYRVRGPAWDTVAPALKTFERMPHPSRVNLSDRDIDPAQFRSSFR